MKKFSGVVVEGMKKGRSLGFPTANINLGADVAVETGIYAGRVVIDKKEYDSALYVAGGNIVEAFIFDFDKDIYGKEVSVVIIKKIRDKQNFNNDAEAIAQIIKDVEEIKKCLQEL